MEFFGEFTALVGSGIISGTAVAGTAGWLFKKWMRDREQTEERLASKIDGLSGQITSMQLEGKECSVLFHQLFRTKADAEKAWEQERQEQDNQWGKIHELAGRVTKIEAACEIKHKK